MNQLWKNINEYEGRYQVSSLGRVKKLIGKDFLGRTRNSGKEYILTPQRGRYTTVSLAKNGTTKTYTVHGLVANAFLESPSCCPTCGTKLEINHRDNNTQNNQSDNLEYVSRKENIQFSALKIQKSVPEKTHR